MSYIFYTEGVDNVGLVRVSIPSANLTSGMVKLMWDEPEDPNGIILTYQIEYRRVDIENVSTYELFISCNIDYKLSVYLDKAND